MYCFTPNASPKLKRNSDNFNVELVKKDAKMYRTVWKVISEDGVYILTIHNTYFGVNYYVFDGDNYNVFDDDNYKNFMCKFYILNGKIYIEYGMHNGNFLSERSELKKFSQITMSMWGLIQSGKIA